MKIATATVNSKDKAIHLAMLLLPNAQYNFLYASKAGYPVYTDSNGWFSDLGTRIEVNYDNGEYMNIWIDE